MFPRFSLLAPSTWIPWIILLLVAFWLLSHPSNTAGIIHNIVHFVEWVFSHAGQVANQTANTK